ncbi:hypothetical protein FA13DRAFT_1169171 [Coprinellus micaceus]|uniref:Uncharacterized protein n=1 Tax=Coprinellus micaceus TaxID=71717 RepID=A0A4Y7SUN0_COPMI|nr:hypothetical protein FA13DRAFT_1169171 [Coprinellus micaceus]
MGSQCHTSICYDESCNYVWVPYARLGGGANNDTIRLASRETSTNLDTQWRIAPLPTTSDATSSTSSTASSTAPITATSDAVASNSSTPRSQVGTIVGGTVAGIALICFTVLGVLWYRLKKRRWIEAQVAPSSLSHPPMTESVSYWPVSGPATPGPHPSQIPPPHTATRRKAASSPLSPTPPNEVLSGSAPSQALSLSTSSSTPLFSPGSQWSTIGLPAASDPSLLHDHPPSQARGPIEQVAEDSGIRLRGEIPAPERPPMYSMH